MDMDTLVSFGGAVKSLGNGKVGGELVLFTSESDWDTGRDFFDGTTDYDFENGEKRTGYYNHGLDIKIGNTKIGRGTLVRDSAAVWLEGQLRERDEYIEAIEEMIKQGALGYSSGALSHLVRRSEPNTKGVTHITHWPIGEWSLTPTPAEPRTKAVSLKSLLPAIKGDVLGDRTERDMVRAAMSSLNDSLMGHIYSTIWDYDRMPGEEEKTASQKADLICAGLDEHCSTGKKMIKAMMSGDTLYMKCLDGIFSGEFSPEIIEIKTERDFERHLRDVGFSQKDAKIIISSGFKSLHRDDAADVKPTADLTTYTERIAEATKQARLTRYEELSRRMEQLHSAA